jgi:hypothetical protein
VILRSGGFSLIHRPAAGACEVLASAAFGTNDPVATQVETLAAALRAGRIGRLRVVLVLCDGWSRTQLLSTPPAPPALTRRVLAGQLGPSEIFCSLPAGQVRDGVATLAAHLVMSASDDDVTVVARALRACSIQVTRVVMLDGALLSHGRRHVAPSASGLRMTAVVEAGWLHLGCYDVGRPVFIRHVETLADLAPDLRAAAVVAEVQRTVLVVRGRLKSPELEGVTVLDPMGLVDRAGIEDGEAQIGAPFRLANVDALPPTSGGDVRAATVAELDPRDLRAVEVAAPVVREGAQRLRVAGAIAIMIACLAGAWVFEHHRRQAGAGAATAAIAVDDGERDVSVLLERARGTLASFDDAFGGLAGHLEARPRMSAIVDVLAATIPGRFVVESLSVNRATDETGRTRRRLVVRIDGLARGTLAACRADIRALHDRMAAIEGVSNVVEAPIDMTIVAKDPEVPGRTLTRFAFTLEWEEGS